MRNLFVIVCLIVALFYASDWFWRSKPQNPKNEALTVTKPQIASLEERKSQGHILLYYDNGNVKAERSFKDGKLNGVYKIYYENGRVKLEGLYKEDKMDGIFRRYDKKGTLLVEEVYKDNLLVERKVFNP